MTDTTTDRPCKECGTEIKFVKNARTGALLPLERVTAYKLHGGHGEAAELVAEPFEAWISHFKTCTKPARFSKGGKR